MKQIIDPRDGDIEDDASSTKRHSLFALAGSLLVEVSLPKLIAAWCTLILIPGLALGLAPMLTAAWLSALTNRLSALAGIGSLVILVLAATIGWFGIRQLFRVVERSFWSLNALLVQPVYALCREALRHLTERLLPPEASETVRARLRAGAAAVAGLIVFLAAAAVVYLIWGSTRWTAAFSELAAPLTLLRPALANLIALIAAYLGLGSLFWGIADATMDQPKGLAAFDAAPPPARLWRIAHLSDIHLVGEPYGWRIECGRDGPRGNERFDQTLRELARLHAEQPLDFIVLSGDMTDAGKSSEWAAFLDAMAEYPALLERLYIIPGNHDTNVVDRANPARLELPISPGKRLRQMRCLSAIAAVQGARVYTVAPDRHHIGPSLDEALAPHLAAIRTFADTGSLKLSRGLEPVWHDVFPMIVPPASEDGLGLMLLNSNAETNFSFTNALGLVPFEDARAMLRILRQYPRAGWIIVLHHHLIEYPMPAEAFSERIGTALINGSWFIRELKPFASRLMILHGHRHIDWIGECGSLRIISAPSPVMPPKRNQQRGFHIHTLATDGGKLALIASQTVAIP